MLKKLGIVAVAVVAGVTSASAQSITFRIGPQPPAPVWVPNQHPYARQHHDVCHRKAWRLREYERYAASDGRINRRERAEMADLQRDLDRTCGRYRWRG